MDKQISLSELILIGSKITRKCKNSFSRNNGHSTCALGAAIIAKRGELITKDIPTTNEAAKILNISSIFVEFPTEDNLIQSKKPLAEKILSIFAATLVVGMSFVINSPLF